MNQLMEELFAFDPKWQQHYKTIAFAARAARVLPEYADWLKTPEGKAYLASMSNVTDTVAQNEAERKLREAARKLM